MAKYIFTKDFSTGGKSPLVFKKGDITEGTFDAGGAGREGEPAIPSIFINIPTGGQYRLPSMDIVNEYTGSINNVSNKEKNTTETKSFFTAKNVIVGVLIIGSILGSLKLLKVI